MNTNPFFSIIIPTYNRASLISIAIESILNQTYTDWELLIVDDGSTDNTKEVVLSFDCPQIKYIYQENQERSAARNNGIENSNGLYICFLDSDDYYTPSRLSNLHKHINQKLVQFYYTDMIVQSPSGLKIFPQNKCLSDNIFDHIILSTINTVEVCIHRDILEKYKFNKAFHIGEDLELWLRIADNYKPIYLEDCADIIVLDHEDRSVNLKSNNNVAQEQLKSLKYIFSEAHSLKKISGKVRKDMMSYCYFGIAKYYIYNSNPLKAIFYILKSMFIQPSHGHTKYKINIIIKLLVSPRKALELITA